MRLSLFVTPRFAPASKAGWVASIVLATVVMMPTKALAAQSVTIAWNPSSLATGYKVLVGLQPGNYVASIDVGNRTTATVPLAAANQTYYFAVRAYNPAGDSAPSSEVGVWIGVVWQTPSLLHAGDFDGDRRADAFVYRSTTGEWFARNSSGSMAYQAWGGPSEGDVPVPADYDGDHKTDFAVYRTKTGQWFIDRTRDGTLILAWGAPFLNDLPVPRDYDGDGRADIAVFRQNTGEWFIRRSSNGTLRKVTWGGAFGMDMPVPGDYNGNGKTDIAVYRVATGQWFVLFDNNSSVTWTWGTPAWGDVPVPADYDGDGKDDLCVFRRASGSWVLRLSATNTTFTKSWGAPSLGDVPVPGDYDGDGEADVAVFRTSTASWYISYSSGGSDSFVWGSPAARDTVGGIQTTKITQIE